MGKLKKAWKKTKRQMKKVLKHVTHPSDIVRPLVSHQVRGKIAKHLNKALDEVRVAIAELKAHDKKIVRELIDKKIEEIWLDIKDLEQQLAANEISNEQLKQICMWVILVLLDCASGHADYLFELFDADDSEKEAFSIKCAAVALFTAELCPLHVAFEHFKEHQNSNALKFLLLFYIESGTHLSESNKQYFNELKTLVAKRIGEPYTDEKHFEYEYLLAGLHQLADDKRPARNGKCYVEVMDESLTNIDSEKVINGQLIAYEKIEDDWIMHYPIKPPPYCIYLTLRKGFPRVADLEIGIHLYQDESGNFYALVIHPMRYEIINLTEHSILVDTTMSESILVSQILKHCKWRCYGVNYLELDAPGLKTVLTELLQNSKRRRVVDVPEQLIKAAEDFISSDVSILNFHAEDDLEILAKEGDALLDRMQSIIATDGESVKCSDDRGYKPLDHALVEGHAKAAKLIIREGGYSGQLPAPVSQHVLALSKKCVCIFIDMDTIVGFNLEANTWVELIKTNHEDLRIYDYENEFGADNYAFSEINVKEIYLEEIKFKQIQNDLQHNGADLDELLNEAARLGHAEACHFFLLLGANVNTQVNIRPLEGNPDNQNQFINEKRTPLMWAITGTNSPAVVGLLLKKGADHQLTTDATQKMTAWHFAFEAFIRFGKKALEVIEIMSFVTDEFDFSTPNAAGKTAQQMVDFNSKTMPTRIALSNALSGVNRNKCFSLPMYITGKYENDSEILPENWWHEFLNYLVRKRNVDINKINLNVGGCVFYFAPNLPGDLGPYWGHYLIVSLQIFYIVERDGKLVAEQITVKNSQKIIENIKQRSIATSPDLVAVTYEQHEHIFSDEEGYRRSLNPQNATTLVDSLKRAYRAIPSLKGEELETFLNDITEGHWACTTGHQNRVSIGLQRALGITVTTIPDLIYKYRTELAEEIYYLVTRTIMQISRQPIDADFNVHYDACFFMLASVGMNILGHVPGDYWDENSFNKLDVLKILLDNLHKHFRPSALANGLIQSLKDKLNYIGYKGIRDPDKYPCYWMQFPGSPNPTNKERGIYLYREVKPCELILIPSQLERDFYLSNIFSAAYVFAEESQEIYYVNKLKNECTRIYLEETQKETFYEGMKIEQLTIGKPRPLSDEELKKITALTDHSPLKNWDDYFFALVIHPNYRESINLNMEDTAFRALWNQFQGKFKKQAYVSKPNAGKGQCGYDVLGMTRQEVYELLTNNLDNAEIRDILSFPLKTALLEPNFCQLLRNDLAETKTDEDLLDFYLNNKIDNPACFDSYLRFDILGESNNEKSIDLLLMLAVLKIKNEVARIWTKAENGNLVPYTLLEDYKPYLAHSAPTCRDIIYYEEHFEEAILFGYDDTSPKEIPPLEEYLPTHLNTEIIQFIRSQCQHYCSNAGDFAEQIVKTVTSLLFPGKKIDEVSGYFYPLDSSQRRISMVEDEERIPDLDFNYMEELTLDCLIDKDYFEGAFVRIKFADTTFRARHVDDAIDYYEYNHVPTKYYTEFLDACAKQFPQESEILEKFLLASIIRNDADMCRIVIERGANIDYAKPYLKASPKEIASYLDFFNKIKFKMEYEIARAVAAPAQPEQLVKEVPEPFLEVAAKIDLRWLDERSPLMLAIANGNLPLILHLLGSGASVNYQNSFGWTALHEAAFLSRKDQDTAMNVLEILIAHRADPLIQCREIDSQKTVLPIHLARLNQDFFHWLWLYTYEGYSHNLWLHPNPPTAEAKARGIYLYRDVNNSKRLHALVVHDPEHHDFISLSKSLEFSDSSVFALPWSEYNHQDFVRLSGAGFHPILERMILSQCDTKPSLSIQQDLLQSGNTIPTRVLRKLSIPHKMDILPYLALAIGLIDTNLNFHRALQLATKAYESITHLPEPFYRQICENGLFDISSKKPGLYFYRHPETGKMMVLIVHNRSQRELYPFEQIIPSLNLDANDLEKKLLDSDEIAVGILSNCAYPFSTPWNMQSRLALTLLQLFNSMLQIFPSRSIFYSDIPLDKRMLDDIYRRDFESAAASIENIQGISNRWKIAALTAFQTIAQETFEVDHLPSPQLLSEFRQRAVLYLGRESKDEVIQRILKRQIANQKDKIIYVQYVGNKVYEEIDSQYQRLYLNIEVSIKEQFKQAEKNAIKKACKKIDLTILGIAIVTICAPMLSGVICAALEIEVAAASLDLSVIAIEAMSKALVGTATQALLQRNTHDLPNNLAQRFAFNFAPSAVEAMAGANKVTTITLDSVKISALKSIVRESLEIIFTNDKHLESILAGGIAGTLNDQLAKIIYPKFNELFGSEVVAHAFTHAMISSLRNVSINLACRRELSLQDALTSALIEGFQVFLGECIGKSLQICNASKEKNHLQSDPHQTGDGIIQEEPLDYRQNHLPVTRKTPIYFFNTGLTNMPKNNAFNKSDNPPTLILEKGS